MVFDVTRPVDVLKRFAIVGGGSLFSPTLQATLGAEAYVSLVMFCDTLVQAVSYQSNGYTAVQSRPNGDPSIILEYAAIRDPLTWTRLEHTENPRATASEIFERLRDPGYTHIFRVYARRRSNRIPGIVARPADPFDLYEYEADTPNDSDRYNSSYNSSSEGTPDQYLMAYGAAARFGDSRVGSLLQRLATLHSRLVRLEGAMLSSSTR